MTKFKRFVAGTYTDDDITQFTNAHIIERDNYPSNGDALFYYRELGDIGVDPLAHIESLNRSVITAETDIFAAELGLVEVAGTLADIEEKLSDTEPHDKAWDSLMAAKGSEERQRTMHEETIKGRQRQIFDLRAKHIELLGQLGKHPVASPLKSKPPKRK